MEFRARFELGMSSWEWASEPKRERARYIAFMKLRGTVETYANYSDEMERAGHSLAEFIEMTPDRQESTLKFVKNAVASGAM